MLNQERVCEMTKMAMFDQNEGQECKPMIEYFRKDYIAKELIKSFVMGTIAFFMIFAMGVLYSAEEIMEQINTMNLRQMAVNLLLCFGIYMVVYLFVTYMVYYMRYTKGRQRVKMYYIHLKKVNKSYQEEEQI